MSLSSHLEQLRQKHADLASQVEEAQNAPGVDDAEVTRLKKEKLRIKDEMRRLAAA